MLFYVRRHTGADGSFERYVLNGHTRRRASKSFPTRAAAAAQRDEVAGEARPGQGESPQASAGRFQNNARSNMPITRCGSTRFWGRRMMGKARLRQLSFWTGHLAGFLDQLDLPLNRCSQPRDTRVSPAVLVSKPNKKVAFVARHNDRGIPVGSDAK